MMKSLRILMATSIILGSLLVVQPFALAQQAGGEQEAATDQSRMQDAKEQPLQTGDLNNLIGKTVKGREGEELGKIESFMSGEDGQPIYALLAGEEGDKLYPIPMDTLMKGRQGDEFTLNFTKDQLKQAPSFEKNNLPNLADAQWQQEVKGYYEKEMKEQQSRQSEENKDRMAQLQSREKREQMTQQPGQPMMQEPQGRQQTALERPFRASELMGKELKSVQDEDLGEIDDVVIDREGKVDYVIISHGGLWGIGDELIPVPLRALQSGTEEDSFMVSINKEKFEQAPNFKESQWPDFFDQEWNQQVYGYYGLENEGVEVEKETFGQGVEMERE